jgi:hypothetical protein
MAEKDEAASQKARAEALRAEIETLRDVAANDAPAQPAENVPLSPRAFIAKKMREWRERERSPR